MSTRNRYQIVVGNMLAAEWTLYGDQSAETDRIVMELIRESLAIARVTVGRAEVTVRLLQVET